MTLVRTAELVERARADGSAALAFNVVTLEHAEAVTAAAELSRRPAILQISHNAVRYHGGLAPIAAASALLAQGAAVELALHLDHVEDLDLLRQATDAGFSSAMIDAGARSYPDNLALTRAAVEWAHEQGVWLEAELGHVGGKPGTPASAHAAGVRTDPAEARSFVAETGVDALAVAVGSSHAMTSRTATLDLDLIGRLRAAVPVPLVLHGSSGVPDEQLRAAVSAGMTKINIGTALNVGFTAAVRDVLGRSEAVDPRRYLQAGREAAATTAAALLTALVTPSGPARPAS